MPRPCKRRRVCGHPSCGRFGPAEQAHGQPEVLMGLDEFETIRLIDLEGLTQEQCAAQMNVARTTVQAIYGTARRKLAQCLVNGRALVIEGGDYELCSAASAQECPGWGCRGRCRWSNCQSNKEENIMKIAVTYDNGQIFQHFGHTEQFKLYDVEDGTVTVQTVVDAGGEGHGALAQVLKAHGVDTLICGGIGGGAQQALAQAGIRLYGGVKGEADAAVEALLRGELAYDPNARCDHHDHAHGEGHCGQGHQHEGHACRHGHCSDK